MHLSRAARRFLPKDVVIVGSARTVIGSFSGKMAALQAPDLGAIAISDAMRRAKVTADDIDYVYFGQVLQAAGGQAPARQAALKAGLHESTDVCGVQKVCSSGLKAITCAATDISLGIHDVIVRVNHLKLSKTSLQNQNLFNFASCFNCFRFDLVWGPTF